MKKITKVLLTAVLMVGILTGCSSKSGAPTRGKWEGNIYTNEYAKLKFTMPDNWTAATNDEIAKMMDSTAEEMSDKSSYSKEALKKQALFDMMAVDGETNTNVIVMYENLKVSNSTKITVDEYITALKGQLKSSAQYRSATITEEADLVLGGETYKTLKIDLSAQGAMQYYYMRKTGDYIACIITTITSDTSIENVMINFS